MILSKCDRSVKESTSCRGVGGCNSTMLMSIFIILGDYFLLLLYHSAELETMT